MYYVSRFVQTGSGAHPASYPMGTGGSYPGEKRVGHEVCHSPHSAEINDVCSYTFTPPYILPYLTTSVLKHRNMVHKTKSVWGF
jgi:hypothetical protein